MDHIDCVSIWRKCSYDSMGIRKMRSGGRVITTKEVIVVSIHRFVLGAIILVLCVSLSLAPGAEGLVKADSLFKEDGFANVG